MISTASSSAGLLALGGAVALALARVRAASCSSPTSTPPSSAGTRSDGARRPTRPARRPAARSRPPVWVGIDLGATNAKAAVVDDTGTVLSNASLPLDTTAEGLKPEPVVRTLLACCEAALSAAGLQWPDISGIGVGSPGGLDKEAGLVKVRGGGV